MGYFGAIYIDNGAFANSQLKQQQNVTLRGTGPHMTSSIARSNRKLDNNVRGSSEFTRTLEFTLRINC